MHLKATVATLVFVAFPVVALNPRCDLCKDGSFPGLPWGAATILQPGGQSFETLTCEQLYFKGRGGGITDQMCKVTQYYMAKPCGCREFNPGPNGPNNGWTVRAPPRPVPVPLPRPAPVAPPRPAPVPMPLPLPRPAPVPPPRPAPVSLRQPIPVPPPRPAPAPTTTLSNGWKVWTIRSPSPPVPVNPAPRTAPIPVSAPRTSSFTWRIWSDRVPSPPTPANALSVTPPGSNPTNSFSWLAWTSHTANPPPAPDHRSTPASSSPTESPHVQSSVSSEEENAHSEKSSEMGTMHLRG